jgi:hypothetical protein
MGYYAKAETVELRGASRVRVRDRHTLISIEFNIRATEWWR